jgi:ribosomal protein S16
MRKTKKNKEKLTIRTLMLPRKNAKNSNWYFVVTRKDKVKKYYFERLGYLNQNTQIKEAAVKLRRVGVWLNKGAKIKSRPAYILGAIAQSQAVKLNIKKNYE